MAPIYLIIALIIQSSLTYANEEAEKPEITEVFKENEENPETDEIIVHDLDEVDSDWTDTYLTPDSLFPSSSATMMTEAASLDKPIEEQLECIKEVADRITLAIQNEMIHLLNFALNAPENEEEVHDIKRRSVETPMDSTQIIMKLLKHIKSNNEYQNIAIDKMMSAQEIADKFGIEFNPDPEILSDLAVAANEHAQELSSMLNEVCDLKRNSSEKISMTPLHDEEYVEIPLENNTYFIYAVYYPDDDINDQQSVSSHEYTPQSPTHSHYSYNYPYETQLKSPSVHHHSHPVSQKPSFYDAVSYSPEYYSSSTAHSPVEIIEPEPELFAEVYEETMSNRVVVERGEESGSATVNHITTYSISEKSHFKTPQIERLPQQMQYSFYLI